MIALTRSILSLIVAAALVSACADMHNIGPTAQLRGPSELGLSAAPTPASAQTPDLVPAVNWWTNLKNSQLNQLVELALADNPNLKVAATRVAKAQSSITLAHAEDLLQINDELNLTRQKMSSNYIYPPPLGGSTVNTGIAQIGARWELDFFGKHRGELVAAVGQLRAAQAEADAARMLLSANVVRTYIQWARLNSQRDVAAQTLKQRQHMLELVRQRVSAGMDNQLQMHENESSRADIRTQLATLEQQIDATQNALAALLGQTHLPENLTAPHLSGLHRLSVPTVLPAQWLGHRADIVAARWRVEAALGAVQVARSQFYPNINLTAFIGLQSLGLNKLPHGDSAQWGVGPAVTLPIFEGGRLRANLRGKSADVDTAIESYNAIVIDAMREVANQSHSVQTIARQQQEQAQALRAAEGTYHIAQQRYEAGLGTYLQVLISETAVLAQRRQQVDLSAQALLNQVGLLQAIGGGWQPQPELQLPEHRTGSDSQPNASSSDSSTAVTNVGA